MSESTRLVGAAGEDRALAHLQTQGLRLLARNWHTPGRGGGELDLVMAAPDGTVVFVEVRARRQSRQGGAAASVGRTKRRRLVLAAEHFLQGLAEIPACRFDVVVIDGERLTWLQAAFSADDV